MWPVFFLNENEKMTRKQWYAEYRKWRAYRNCFSATNLVVSEESASLSKVFGSEAYGQAWHMHHRHFRDNSPSSVYYAITESKGVSPYYPLSEENWAAKHNTRLEYWECEIIRLRARGVDYNLHDGVKSKLVEVPHG